MSARKTEMYKKIFNQFSPWLNKLHNDNKKKDLLMANIHTWGYITALVDYNIITQEEYQYLRDDLKVNDCRFN